jgi:hypothetical protein
MRDKLTRDGSNTTRKTAVRLTAETKDAVLGKLRHAVAFQIGLWDTALEIAEMVDADLGLVLEWINATSVVADSGLELGPKDLEDLLGGDSDVYKVGGKLSEHPIGAAELVSEWSMAGTESARPKKANRT